MSRDDNFDKENYVGVHDRIAQFREKYPEGHIVTTKEDLSEEEVDFKAEVFRTGEEAAKSIPASTGYSRTYISEDNDKCLERGETVAIGRALAILGFEITKALASKEEIEAYKQNKNIEEPVEQEEVQTSSKRGGRRSSKTEETESNEEITTSRMTSRTRRGSARTRS